MNKNLEKEYKDFYEQELSIIDEEALWNKIEAALPEKENAIVHSESRSESNKDCYGENHDESGGENNNDRRVENSADRIVKPKTVWYKQPRFITLIGSAAAVVILGFLLSSNTIYKTALSKTDSATAENAYQATDSAPTFNSETAMEESSETEYVPSNDIESEEVNAPEYTEVINGQCIEMNFEVVGDEEGYFVCVLLEENDFFDEGTAFFLEKSNAFTEGEKYIMQLEYIEKTGEKIFFKIF